MEKSRLNILIIVAVVIIVFVLVMVYQLRPMQTGQNMGSNQVENSPSASPSASPGPSASKLSYDQALALYKNKRIQFDQSCVMVPNYVTFKKGVTIMLDNRASKQRIIALDNQKYSFPAYSFKIVTLSTTATLPHTISVDCGTGQNNGSIVLQK